MGYRANFNENVPKEGLNNVIGDYFPKIAPENQQQKRIFWGK